MSGFTALIITVMVGVAFGATVAWIAATKVANLTQRSRAYDTAMRIGVYRPEDGSADTLDALMVRIERAVRDMRAELHDAGEVRERMQGGLDAIPQAILVFDDTGMIIAHNAAAEAFIEARHSDAIVGAAASELVASALAGHSANRTLELFGPPRRSIVVSSSPLSTESSPAAVVMVEDITEIRRLEDMRTDFVANISHELKTPVGAISLLAETLQAENDPVVIRRLASRVHSEAIRVGHTIEDLLELSRIEVEEPEEFRIVEVDDIVEESLDRIRPAAEQVGITVTGPDRKVDLLVRGDRRQLISAISNLLDNAVKYSDPGSAVQVDAVRDGSDVCIVVADEGIGIPVRDIERVFERFYRVDQARSRQTGGTGLGLAIVRHVVVNHEGRIEVESRLGEGSSFTLRLPAASRPKSVGLGPVPGRVAPYQSPALAPAQSLPESMPDPMPESMPESMPETDRI